MLISHGCLVCLHLIEMERKIFFVWYCLVLFGLVYCRKSVVGVGKSVTVLLRVIDV
jgi:hypothetical protein